MTFREQLRAAMSERKITVPTLSALTGIPIRTIENWRTETQNRREPADYIQKSILERIKKMNTTTTDPLEHLKSLFDGLMSYDELRSEIKYQLEKRDDSPVYRSDSEIDGIISGLLVDGECDDAEERAINEGFNVPGQRLTRTHFFLSSKDSESLNIDKITEYALERFELDEDGEPEVQEIKTLGYRIF